MRIKRLSIHGFKSFVDRVVLDFPALPSAVIGPNGCGKSNIVDAIRWVTGEQNPRHLRGSQMEDVIFNGSEGRGPLGMAEVVLTFANERGRAPERFAAFTEIEVARRLYRSGESEYSINKVRCRLRDIVDLFTDTGVGKRAYSIVEQGQVGWIINAKPDERRVLFEEAAGINKFKNKKDTALRRLESTRENLTRVNDIIGEVKRQLNSLNRQAKKAERYKVLRDELKGIEVSLAGGEFTVLKENLAGSIKKLNVLKDSEIELSSRISSKEIRAEELKNEYLELESSYNGIKEKVFGLEKAVQASEREIEVARMRVEELSRNEKRIMDELDGLGEKSRAAVVEIEEIKEALEDTNRMIEERTGKFEELLAELDAVLGDIKERAAEEALLRSGLLTDGVRLSDVKHSMQTCLKEEGRFRAGREGAIVKLEEIKRAAESAREPLNALRETIEESRRKKEFSGSGLETVIKTLALLEKRREGIDGELKEAKEAHASQSARLKTIEEMERNFENIHGGARSIMLKGDMAGVRGILADLIETNPGYEKAVEAVLGNRLQYVVVDGQHEGLDALRYLKTNSGGRGSFVPVKDLRPLPNPVAIEAGHGLRRGMGDLKNEVIVREGYTEVVNAFLRDTVVVEDLNSAVEIWSRNGMYKTLVTLDGDVISPEGILSGGAPGGADDEGILERRKEIKDIRKTLSRLETRIFELEDALKGLDSDIGKGKTELDEHRNSFHSMEIEAVNFESDLKRREAELDALLNAGHGLEAEISGMEDGLEDISAKKIILSREREGLEKVIAEKEDALARIRDGISEVEMKKEGLSKAVTEIKVEVAQATERSVSLRARKAEKEGVVGEIEALCRVKTEEISRGKTEATEKTKVIDEAGSGVEALLKEIEGAKREETEMGENIGLLSARTRETESEARGLTKDLAEIQELKGEITVDLKEMELKIGHLKERIMEKYGIDIENYTPDGDGAEPEPQDTDLSSPDLSSIEARRDELRSKLTSMGEVSMTALEEFNELEGRYTFLIDQQEDLTRSVETLMKAISRINRTTRERFLTAFNDINEKFKENFPRFFNGGKAELRLTDDGDVLESGIEIAAQPPGKRLQNMALLSGGEKALTATALIFSIFLIKPSPFCLLDEVDAPLDDANIDRFNSFVREMSSISQFILITHNKRTMEIADTLYGITMEEPGVSKIISVKF